MRKANINRNQCVSCGCCVKVCPKDAIKIVNGVYAEVNTKRCVGCGICKKACPASIIEIMEVLNAE